MDLCALRKKTGEPAFRQPCEGIPKPALWSICHPLLAVRVTAHTSAASHSETLSGKKRPTMPVQDVASTPYIRLFVRRVECFRLIKRHVEV